MSILTTVECKGSRLISQKKLSMRIVEVLLTLVGKVIVGCRPAAYKLYITRVKKYVTISIIIYGIDCCITYL